MVYIFLVNVTSKRKRRRRSVTSMLGHITMHWFFIYWLLRVSTPSDDCFIPLQAMVDKIERMEFELEAKDKVSFRSPHETTLECKTA